MVLLALLTAKSAGLGNRSDGLLGWDAYWYQHIAADGYAHVASQGIRFFPLLPLMTRYAAALTGGDRSVSLLVLSNLGALAYALLACRVALSLGLSHAQAALMPWVIAFRSSGY